MERYNVTITPEAIDMLSEMFKNIHNSELNNTSAAVNLMLQSLLAALNLAAQREDGKLTKAFDFNGVDVIGSIYAGLVQHSDGQVSLHS